jgi:hypothetical protein
MKKRIFALPAALLLPALTAFADVIVEPPPLIPADPDSPSFWIAIALVAVVIAVTVLLLRRFFHKPKGQ